MKHLALPALAAVLSLTVSAASASEVLLQEMDFDGDGITTVDEATAARNALFDPADADGDGALSLGEHAALLAAIAARDAEVGRGYAASAPAAGRVEAFTFADSNADGQISRLEFHSVSRRLARSLDRDGDGVLSEGDFRLAGGI
ncbi:EF-hand domain-containing protein [Roseobacteraceae bacterium NS-SX3]